MRIEETKPSQTAYSVAKIDVGAADRKPPDRLLRAAWLHDFYDADGRITPEALSRLTPGTAAFAVLDATVRRERRHDPHWDLFHHMNRQYATGLSATRRQDRALPAFDHGTLHRIRALLQASPRSQNTIMEDDLHSEDMLRWYAHLCTIVTRNPAAIDQDPEATLVSGYDFGVELGHSFAALYAKRRSADPWGDAEKSNAIGTRQSAALGRVLLPEQVHALKQHWSGLGGIATVNETNDRLDVTMSPVARVSICKDRISLSGLGTLDEGLRLETARLAVLHARDNWGAAMTITEASPAGAARMMAFAELFGVNVVSCDIHVEREAVDGLKQELRQRYESDGRRRERPAPPADSGGLGRQIRRFVRFALSK